MYISLPVRLRVLMVMEWLYKTYDEKVYYK